MNVYWIPTRGIEPRQAEQHGIEDLKFLLTRAAGIVWGDLHERDEHAPRRLSEGFGFHSLALRGCLERCLLPMVQPYADRLFVVVDAP